MSCQHYALKRALSYYQAARIILRIRSSTGRCLSTLHQWSEQPKGVHSKEGRNKQLLICWWRGAFMNGFVVCVVVWIGVFLLLKFLEVRLSTVVCWSNVDEQSSQYRNQLYNLLNQLNLEISIGYVKWYTSKFNRAIVNLVRGSEFKRKAFSLWFFVGTCVSLLLGASSLLLLLYNMYSIIYAHPNEQPVMTPLVRTQDQ